MATPAPMVTVSMESTEPFCGGLAGLGAKSQVTPAGRFEQLRVTGLLKEFTDVMVQVLCVVAPRSPLGEFGAQERPKSCAVVTRSDMSCDRVNPPLVPVIWNGYVFSATVLLTLIVTWESIVPLGGGVGCAGLNPQVAPAGNPVQASVTGLLNPNSDVIVAIVPVLPPGGAITEVGLAETV